ncbi:hydrogen peroxide-inducible genes activator [Acidihalobacter ferrooxydans]|uniref:LysR family transcriptional regulator n=1 Tax=Acidihalobacter ferrooxydans TaxID=1765967 RepID=A0A1P8UI86_9GAMM|nr:hydrogen peroxide-inducible genes activator [Acidihalobacter ferrooxydans]APZ43537.1 LysR family transcriptional regulator [Acidihalobacter ferrooxydans]
MTLNELRYIVALARERHFGRAAETAFISQPTLSVAVKKLEDELGVHLFERAKHEVTPTPVGERIIEQAQAVLESVQRIRETARGDFDQLHGPLRLAAIYTIGPYLLPNLIPELHDRAPEMPLMIEEGYTHELRRRLKQGEVDAILIALPFEEPGVVTLPLYDEPFVAVLPTTHPLALQQDVALTELAGADFLMLGQGHCFRDQVIEYCPECGRSVSAEGHAALIGSSLETLRHMVASGLGVTVLPCTAVGADRYAQRLLAVRRLKSPTPSRRVALAWRVSFPRPKAIEVLRQAIHTCPMSCVTSVE